MEIAELEGFKKELKLIPLTISNVVGIVDNYIRLKQDLAERDNEIKCLKTELELISAENINFNNVSLVKQQDKIVNDLQIEIAYLKKQVAKYTSTGGNTTAPPSPKLPTPTQSDIQITPLTTVVPTAGVVVPATDTESKPSATAAKSRVRIVGTQPLQTKPTGRKSTKSSKVEAEPSTVDVPIHTEIAPKEEEIAHPPPPVKRTRKKKTEQVVSTTLEDSPTNPLVDTPAVESIPEPISEKNDEHPQPVDQHIDSQVANTVAIANAIMPNPDETKLAQEIEEVVDVQTLEQKGIKAGENVKVVGAITLSYDEPISVNEQIPEIPDVNDMDDIITINSVKYWLYNGLLFQFISNNKVGSFIRKYEAA